MAKIGENFQELPDLGDLNYLNLHNEDYNVLKLIKDLKKELQDILKFKITDKKLSEYLGKDENYVKYVKKNSKRNPQFQISSREISGFMLNLSLKLKYRGMKVLNYIKKYEKTNTLKQGPEKIYNFHPNIKLNYFKDINTKDKAYWLGFMYADGCISYKRGGRYNKSLNLRIRFGLKASDTDSVDAVNRFAKNLGINPDFINIKSNGLYGFEITSDILAKQLCNYGLIIGKGKTYNIQLPRLKSRDLYLSFLLGFFDGDGKQKSTKITSSSFNFLNQIKMKFQLPYRIVYEKSQYGGAFTLHLGADLFNDMLDNYQNSMPRKRIRFVTREELIERHTKIKITEEILKELESLVLSIPLKDLAIYYSITPSRLGQICKENNIKIPPRGYWRRKQIMGISPIYLESLFKC